MIRKLIGFFVLSLFVLAAVLAAIQPFPTP